LKVPGKIVAIPSTVGLWTIDSFAYIGGLATLAGQSAYVTFIGPFRGQRLHPERSLHQAMAVGVGAIPIVSLITFFVGLIMALQSAYELRQLGAIQFVAGAVAVAILRELGPLLTAIVVIGRSGSAFAAEIGTKKVTEEVDALRTMAFDPVAFLVAPKFLAMLVMDAMPHSLGRLHGRCGRKRLRCLRGRLHSRLLFSGDTGCACGSRHLYGPDQECIVWPCHHGCRVPGRFRHRRGRRGGWTLDHVGRRDFDCPGCGCRPGIHNLVLFLKSYLSRGVRA
jgi:hypothetical protein